MTIMKNYNIYDLVKFQINSPHMYTWIGNMNQPFAFFETSAETNAPDVVLNIGPFSPSNADCYVVDHEYHVRDNYIYCKDSEGSGQWEFEIFGVEKDQTVINYNGRFLGFTSFFTNLIAQEVLLFPALMYKLGKKGYYLIHAGGVSKSGSAYIFAGRGGSHKTRIVKELMNLGFNYLGDDWVILHEGQALPFPKYVFEFMFSMQTGSLPTESSSSIIEKLKYLLYMRNAPPKADFLTDVKAKSLKTLFMVSKANRPSIDVMNISKDVCAKELVANNLVDLASSPSIFGNNYGHYLIYLQAYAYIFPNSEIASFWNEISNGLKTNLNAIDAYQVTIPEKYTPDLTQKLLQIINGQ